MALLECAFAERFHGYNVSLIRRGIDKSLFRVSTFQNISLSQLLAQIT